MGFHPLAPDVRLPDLRLHIELNIRNTIKNQCVVVKPS